MNSETKKLPALHDGDAPIIRDAQQDGQLVVAEDFIEYLGIADDQRPQDIRCLACNGELALFLRAKETGRESYFKHRPGQRCQLLSGPSELQLFNSTLSLTKALQGKQAFFVQAKCSTCYSLNPEWQITNFAAAAVVAIKHEIVLLSGTGAALACVELYSGFAAPLLPWSQAQGPPIIRQRLNVLDVMNYVELAVTNDASLGTVLTLTVPTGKVSCITCQDREIALKQLKERQGTTVAQRALNLVMLVETAGAAWARVSAPNQWPGDGSRNLISVNDLGILPPDVCKELLDLDVDTLKEIGMLLRQREREADV